MYDKQGSVLRIETVINDARDLKVYRSKEADEAGQKQWLRLRKGVADLHRRAEVSQKANDRYADSLAQVAATKPLREVTEPFIERGGELEGPACARLEPAGCGGRAVAGSGESWGVPGQRLAQPGPAGSAL
jgi:hypothetical protein